MVIRQALQPIYARLKLGTAVTQVPDTVVHTVKALSITLTEAERRTLAILAVKAMAVEETEDSTVFRSTSEDILVHLMSLDSDQGDDTHVNMREHIKAMDPKVRTTMTPTETMDMMRELVYAAQKDLEEERRMRLPTERELTEALEARLDLAIMADWQAAMTTRSTRHKLTDATGTLRRRPRDAAAFIRRWGSVCEIVRGRCTPRSRWIDQQGPALTLDVGD
jgi:hypothetical protein